MNNNYRQNIIHSFFMGGFECCDMLNCKGDRVDLLEETEHIEFVEHDYGHLRKHNILSVREGIRWSKVEIKPYTYNWNEFRHLLVAGEKHGIQQIWDLCHFGMPDDLTPMHPHFLQRFVRLCTEFISEYRKVIPFGPAIITPINEVSFFSWLGGEVGNTVPYNRGCGWEVKYKLTQAYIAGIKAMKAIDKDVIILSTEPLVDIVPSKDGDQPSIAISQKMHEEQYQVTDMIFGRICPELGGDESLIDIIGYNFYYNNRFSIHPGDIISWTNEFSDPRFRPLNALLSEGYHRYSKPIILSETSHPDEHRGEWLSHVLEETNFVLLKGIPLWGVCWYPILDRPDWDDLNNWHNAGLWNMRDRELPQNNAIHEPLIEIIEKYQPQFSLINSN